LKLLITKTLYHSLIQWSIVLYQTMIHLFALEEKQAEAFRQARASASRNCADSAFKYRSAGGDLREFSTFKLSTLAPSLPGCPNAEPSSIRRRPGRYSQRVSAPWRTKWDMGLMREVRRTELVAAIGTPCRYCGEPMAAPTRDHIRPRRKGGRLTVGNKVLVCDPCKHRQRRPLAGGMAVQARKGGRSAGRHRRGNR